MKKPNAHIYFISYFGCSDVMVGRTRGNNLDKLLKTFTEASPTKQILFLGDLEAVDVKAWYENLLSRIEPLRISSCWYRLSINDVIKECEDFKRSYCGEPNRDQFISIDKWLEDSGYYPVKKMRDGQIISKRAFYFLYTEWASISGISNPGSQTLFSKHLHSLGFLLGYQVDSLSVGGMQ